MLRAMIQDQLLPTTWRLATLPTLRTLTFDIILMAGRKNILVVFFRFFGLSKRRGTSFLGALLRVRCTQQYSFGIKLCEPFFIHSFDIIYCSLEFDDDAQQAHA